MSIFNPKIRRDKILEKKSFKTFWHIAKKFINLLLLIPALGAFFTLFSIAISALLISNFIIVISGERHITEHIPNVTLDYVIVLGAGVRGPNLSGALRSRMDIGINLLQRQLANYLFLSGDGTELDYNETLAMKRYALNNGITASRIITDSMGYSTYDSILRAKNNFGITRAYIVSQKFHLPRTLWLANAVGMNAIGITTGPIDDELYYSIREIPARSKDFFLHFLDYFPQGKRDSPF